MSYVGDGDFSRHTGIKWDGQFHGQAQYGSDSILNVWFYKHPVFNQSRSENEGRPCYDDRDFIHIQHPGETQQIMERPATQVDARRFPQQWAAYQQSMPQKIEGTLIDLLFPGKPSISEGLKASGVHTVEQLANISADGMNNLGMAAQEYVNMAKRFIDSAKDGKEFHAMKRALDESHSQIRVLQQQVQSLVAQIGKMNPALAAAAATQAPAPVYDVQAAQIAANHPTTEAPKRGRPRKNGIG